MRRTLYLARHGETPWNLEGRWQGRTDIALSDLGREQARALGERLLPHGIARVHTSDLRRAHETAEIVAGVLGIAAVTVDVDLRERGFGIFEGMTLRDCETRYPEAWARYLADRKCLPEGAEPEKVVIERMRRAIDRVLGDLGQDPVLLVSHGSAIRTVLSAMVGRSFPPVPNVGVFRVEVDGEATDCVLL